MDTKEQDSIDSLQYSLENAIDEGKCAVVVFVRHLDIVINLAKKQLRENPK